MNTTRRCNRLADEPRITDYRRGMRKSLQSTRSMDRRISWQAIVVVTKPMSARWSDTPPSTKLFNQSLDVVRDKRVAPRLFILRPDAFMLRVAVDLLIRHSRQVTRLTDADCVERATGSEKKNANQLVNDSLFAQKLSWLQWTRKDSELSRMRFSRELPDELFSTRNFFCLIETIHNGTLKWKDLSARVPGSLERVWLYCKKYNAISNCNVSFYFAEKRFCLFLVSMPIIASIDDSHASSARNLKHAVCWILSFFLLTDSCTITGWNGSRKTPCLASSPLSDCTYYFTRLICTHAPASRLWAIESQQSFILSVYKQKANGRLGTLHKKKTTRSV